MRYFYYILLIVLFSSHNLNAQSAGKKTIENIKNSGEYYWGESGNSLNPKDGNNKAIEKLLQNIKQNYKGRAQLISGKTDEHLDAIYKSFESDIKHLSGSKPVDMQKNNFIRYMKKTEFDSLCDERENYIDDAIARGLEMEEKESMGDALRSYYKALLLCYSHPNSQAIKYPTEDGEKKVIPWLIEEKIDGILQSTKFHIKEWIDHDDYSEAKVSIYNNHKVSNIRFYYYDPIEQNYKTCNVENGNVSLKFEKGVDQSYIMIDFSYPDFETSEPVAYMINNIIGNNITFPKSTYQIKKEKGSKKTSKTNDSKSDDNDITGSLQNKYQVDSKTASECQTTMRRIEAAINNKNIETVKDCFTSTGFNDFKKLLGYDDVAGARMTYSIFDKNINYCFIYYKDEIICRSIPMQFEYSDGMIFNRSISFRFNKSDKLINSVAIRLSASAEYDILAKTQYKTWDEDARLTLINFLEDFQTAYMTKNLPFLNNIYSEDALIIVGHRVNKKPVENSISLSNEEFEYNQLSKSNYLNNLDKLFRAKKYVNIRFTDVCIEQSRRANNVFGINVAQSFATNTYMDNGYLFLYVDLREKDPMIYVRTWQPEKTTVEEQFTLRKLH